MKKNENEHKINPANNYIINTIINNRHPTPPPWTKMHDRLYRRLKRVSKNHSKDAITSRQVTLIILWNIHKKYINKRISSWAITIGCVQTIIIPYCKYFIFYIQKRYHLRNMFQNKVITWVWKGYHTVYSWELVQYWTFRYQSAWQFIEVRWFQKGFWRCSKIVCCHTKVYWLAKG